MSQSKFPAIFGRTRLAGLALLASATLWAGGGIDLQRRNVFETYKVEEIKSALGQAVLEKKTPGGVFWMEREKESWCHAFGQKSMEPELEEAAQETLYDLASLTKVVATTPAIALLLQRGQLELDAPASRYLSEFDGEGREKITVRHLLTHLSGLRPGLSRHPDWQGYDTAIRLACAEKPQHPPGTNFTYSDINFILLGEVVQRISRRPLQDFVREEIFLPLQMTNTGYLPNDRIQARIAPTERREGTVLRGVVHDPTAWRMGGVAGHAGVFSTASDLARYARMLLGEGQLGEVKLFRPDIVRLMTSIQTPDSVSARRGLGWDIDSPYSRPRGSLFPVGSYGHTGWTGTCLWVDPYSKSFWILLSNRVHPDGRGNILALQNRLGTLVAESLTGIQWPGTPASDPLPLEGQTAQTGKPVMNGIDVLVKNKFAPLRGRRVGLITNQTGVDRNRKSLVELLRHAPGVDLRCIFSPEHGFRGDREGKIQDDADSDSGLPIISLYGEHRAPLPEHLKDLDVLVFDIQDIGCRFYTYISTMGLCLEAAARQNVSFMVLDRVNPITGEQMEGPLMEGESHFTGFHSIPIRHGMTVGELAQLFNSERGWNANLSVIPLEGWSRSRWFDETGLPWVDPSPNMRRLAAAVLYPGIGLLEMTALSVGRGTDTPFEVVGAPYIHDIQMALDMNEFDLKGVRFTPVRFTPKSSVFASKECHGVAIQVIDREQFEPVKTGLAMAQVLYRRFPRQFSLEKLNVLLRNQKVIQAIKDGKPLAEIYQTWEKDLAEFQKRRAQFLLYPVPGKS